MDVNVNLVKKSEIIGQRRSTRSASAHLFRLWDRLVAGHHNVSIYLNEVVNSLT